MTRSVLMDHSTSNENLIALMRSTLECGTHWCADSRLLSEGDVFVAYPGKQGDGREYIDAAIASGAAAVLMHVDTVKGWQTAEYAVPLFAVLQLKDRLGALADLWYDKPSASLTVVAVTGTNGKTSCVDWFSQALRNDGQKVGIIGTLGVTFPDGRLEPGQLTTPDVISVHRTMAVLREAGATHVAMEASSIGLDQGRLAGVRIHTAGFTNLSRDHLDYHQTMQAYEAAKSQLFAWPGLQVAVLNLDDPVGVRLSQRVTCHAITYSISKQVDTATLTASALRTESSGMGFLLQAQDEQVAVQSHALGTHNVSNLLCVSGLLRSQGWSVEKISQAIARLAPVEGRLERVRFAMNDVSVPTVVVDYAHTPDALERVLRTLRPLAESQQGKLWCVFGCGGNRDAGKRPIMGAIAQRLADQVIVTSDNPRHEEPATILTAIVADISGQVRNVHIVQDRAQAILQAVLEADAADVILIAGKGHETYQEISGVRKYFDDRQWAQAAFVLMQGRAIQTDSRKLDPGAVFVALRGDNFDGHAYLKQVAEGGAAAAIVESVDSSVALPQIALGDTRAALLSLGHAWRRRFSIPMIAVTGSNGKTTTKEMIAAILAACYGPEQRLATVGNLNNELGVPLTLMRLRQAHKAAVIELGMNHPGEIEVLADLVEPTVALVNNAQREHQEFMESVEAVARENAAVFGALRPEGVKVFPADEEFSSLWKTISPGHAALCFGMTSQAQVWPSDVVADALGSTFTLNLPNGTCSISLPVPGMHNIKNALAAAACTYSVGVPVQAIMDGLGSFQAVSGRMQTHRLSDKRVLIDDTYNANPDSVRAAIEVLASLPAPRVLVLGDMGEVGDQGPEMHREVGAYAREHGIEYLLTLGDATQQSAEAFGVQAVAGTSVEHVCEVLHRLPVASVLVKGSRFMRMERIVKEYLKTTGINPEEVVKHAV
ncbi:bifunctional UDP-N-acetylmuramoyl-L-alanyl-D-glutamate--2,6-diaminopimelate ligase MurE/UDP-N-acetylmuramoyl-tripeptide--D-alanyl-D-alanine ligase MurF [Zwartia sp.]|uniref:bifunctional UDP-N-acetylmuramoyl-L-alanyl-D-glutamate--2, 6-diaminopimelate ligase MurE/UDP-N-acetylmuramoyl-tripeptide--D-alanyl-D-alanine ligase MurF n=1 Tax=Zwartia sp. TaxID=2978004 RepID=UPI003BB1F1F6